MVVFLELLKKLNWKIFFYFLFFCFGYYVCCARYSLKQSELNLQYEQEKTNLLNAKIEAEKRQKENINKIENDYLLEIHGIIKDYEQEIYNLSNKYNFNGGVQYDNTKSTKCVHRTARNTADLQCYTNAELYKKIERSLAITNECDKLAIKYNALLQVCNKK